MIEHQSLQLPILRHQRDALFDRLGGTSHLLRNAVEPELAPDDRPQSEDGLQDLRAAAADQAGEAMNLPIHQREVDAAQAVVDDARQGEKLAPARAGASADARAAPSSSRAAFVSAMACFGPTIAATSVLISVSAVLNVPTLAPSRKTVTR